MEQRFVVFDDGSGPRIYKIPINRTARLVNEFPDRRVQVFETLDAAKEAALAIVGRAETDAKPSFTSFAPAPTARNEGSRKALSDLTEDRVETYYF
jgi:hypothetical protein